MTMSLTHALCWHCLPGLAMPHGCARYGYHMAMPHGYARYGYHMAHPAFQHLLAILHNPDVQPLCNPLCNPGLHDRHLSVAMMILTSGPAFASLRSRWALSSQEDSPGNSCQRWLDTFKDDRVGRLAWRQVFSAGRDWMEGWKWQVSGKSYQIFLCQIGYIWALWGHEICQQKCTHSPPILFFKIITSFWATLRILRAFFFSRWTTVSTHHKKPTEKGQPDLVIWLM